MPGISQFYRDLSVKPATFLQLLWDFQAAQAANGPANGCPTSAPRRRRR